MKYLYFLMIGFSFAEGSLKEPFKKGDILYLNGKGGKGEKYFSAPYEMGPVIECANTVTLTEKSSYGRPFQTHAESTIKIKNKKVIAHLDNFRDLIIKDESGTDLIKRKITGATSLYEIKYKDQTIAWGVGWHKNHRESYKLVDFTTFRVYLPTIKNGKLHIEEKLINGLSQNRFHCALKDDALVLIEGKPVGFGALSYYYGLPNFIIVDPKTGFKDIADAETLENNIDFEKLNNTSLILWFIKNKESQTLRKYMIENIEILFNKNALIFDEKTDEWTMKFDPSNKEKCIQFLKESQNKIIPFSKDHIVNLFKKCMPRIENPDLKDPEYTIKNWLEELLNIDDF